MKRLFMLLVLFGATSFATEVDRLLEEYGRINSVTCHIRRTVQGEAGSVEFISRVYWQKDDRLHVENLTPVPRRIIADGTRFYSYAQGDPKGFSREISALSTNMLMSLRKIPGTATDHLLRLKGIPEQILPPVGALRQAAYQTENNYVVLRFDTENRLVEIDFFKTSEMTGKTASYRYSNFLETEADGAWVPLLQKADMSLENGSSFSETTQTDRYIVNKPIAASLFDPEAFFDKEVDFVDSFERIYGE